MPGSLCAWWSGDSQNSAASPGWQSWDKGELWTKQGPRKGRTVQHIQARQSQPREPEGCRGAAAPEPWTGVKPHGKCIWQYLIAQGTSHRLASTVLVFCLLFRKEDKAEQEMHTATKAENRDCEGKHREQGVSLRGLLLPVIPTDKMKHLYFPQQIKACFDISNLHSTLF